MARRLTCSSSKDSFFPTIRKLESPQFAMARHTAPTLRLSSGFTRITTIFSRFMDIVYFFLAVYAIIGL